MIYDLLMFPDTKEPERIEKINSGEVCEICIIINNQVATYFRDILLRKKIKENIGIVRSTDLVQYFLKTIQQYTLDDTKSEMRCIRVNNITTYCKESDDNFVSHRKSKYEFGGELGKAHMFVANPNTIVQLLKIIMNNCLSCLSNRLISYNIQRLVRRCKKEFKSLINSLQQIIDNLPFTSAVYDQGHIRVQMVAVQVDVTT
jgi:hypothetical protein